MENPISEVLYVHTSQLGFIGCNIVTSFFPPLPEMPFRLGTWDAAFDSHWSPHPFPPDLATEGSSLLRNSGERKGKLDPGVWAKTLLFLLQKKKPSALISEGPEPVYVVSFFFPQKVNHTQNLQARNRKSLKQEINKNRNSVLPLIKIYFTSWQATAFPKYQTGTLNQVLLLLLPALLTESKDLFWSYM